MQMSHARKPSGMKLVVIIKIKQLEDQEIPATPNILAREFNMTYRHILRIAYDLAEEGLIDKVIDNWKVRYELTNEGKRVLY